MTIGISVRFLYCGGYINLPWISDSQFDHSLDDFQNPPPNLKNLSLIRKYSNFAYTLKIEHIKQLIIKISTILMVDLGFRALLILTLIFIIIGSIRISQHEFNQ